MSKYLVDHKSLVIHRTAYICHACQHNFILNNYRDFTNSEDKVHSLVEEQLYTYCPNCAQELILPPY